MTGRRAGVIVSVLCAVLVVACGDDDAADDIGQDIAGGDVAGSVYTGELADGSELVVRLGVPADDPAVAPFEEFRATTGAAEPTWIVGAITPPAGADATGRFLTFVEPGADRLDDDPADDSDGVTNSDFACAVIEDWFGVAGTKDEALTDAYMEVYDGPCGGQAHQALAPAGETTTYVMVYDGGLPDFESVEAELGNELSPA